MGYALAASLEGNTLAAIDKLECPLRLSTAAALLFSVLLFSAPALAGLDDFATGPVIDNYGAVAPVDAELEIPEGAEFRVAFDISNQAESGEVNRQLVTAARFLNMHVAAGIPAERIHLAIVVHGGAVLDVSQATLYAGNGAPANADLVAALVSNGVEIYVCGQSAVYHNVTNDDLMPGVTMALSAMTVHALLQQGGYTLNPF
tara:strand:+ start:50017 stop:50625 length:609 start_codon:yes stop_codon:yes gene_type:complete